MQLELNKKLLFLLLPLAILASGCNSSAFKPAAEVSVVSVEPYNIIPDSFMFSDVEQPAISLALLSQIPCSLVSYSIRYCTPLGEEIKSLAVNNIPINYSFDLEEDSDVEITINAYTKRVLEFYSVSQSGVSPITAKIDLTFEDYHKNIISRKASCLLHRPEVIEE